MIKSLFIDNYKTLVNFTLDFSRLNLLIGGNGTGKSSVISCISALCNFIYGEKSLGEAFPSNTLTRWQELNKQTFELKLDEYTYKLVVEQNPGRARVISESLLCNEQPLLATNQGEIILHNDSFTGGTKLLSDWTKSALSIIIERPDNTKIIKFRKLIEKIVVCTIEPISMKDERMANNPRALFSFDANSKSRALFFPDATFSNLVNVYADVMMTSNESIAKIVNEYKEIRPQFKGASFDKDDRVTLKFCIGGAEYKLSELSDGEKVLFALNFLQVGLEDLGWTLILDEPDNYISSREVQPFLQRIEDCEGQCLIASHNAEIIDYWSTYAILLGRGGYNKTRIMTISDSSLQLSKRIALGDIGAEEEEAQNDVE